MFLRCVEQICWSLWSVGSMTIVSSLLLAGELVNANLARLARKLGNCLVGDDLVPNGKWIFVILSFLIIVYTIQRRIEH